MTDFLLRKACNCWEYIKRRDSACCVRHTELLNLMNKELVQKVRFVFSCSRFSPTCYFADRTPFNRLPSSIEMCSFSNDRFADIPLQSYVCLSFYASNICRHQVDVVFVFPNFDYSCRTRKATWTDTTSTSLLILQTNTWEKQSYTNQDSIDQIESNSVCITDLSKSI